MRARQRLISAALTVLLVPAFLLAGTPLRLCLGFDGHQAIELVLQVKHHAADPQQDRAIEALAMDEMHQSIGGNADCIDQILVTTAHSVKLTQDAVDRPVLSNPVPVCLLSRVLGIDAASDFTPNHAVSAAVAHGYHPQLASLRTVILRT